MALNNVRLTILFNSCFHFLRQAVASGYKMTAVVFSPSKNVMNVDEVQRKGYAIANTPTRLVLRSPHNAEETYLQNVSWPPWTGSCSVEQAFGNGGPTWTRQHIVNTLCPTEHGPGVVAPWTGSWGSDAGALNLNLLWAEVAGYSSRCHGCLSNTRLSVK